MLRLLLGLVVNAVALWVAALIVPGISLVERHYVASYAPLPADYVPDGAGWTSIGALLMIAVVFTLVNAVIKPLVQLLSLPAIVLTLGLFLLVVNALMLMLTSWITTTVQPFGAEYAVSGFWAAFFGAIVIGLVNWALGMLVPDSR